MNNDSNLIFERYQQRILNELTLGGDYAAIGPAVAKGVKEREEVKQADTYLFGILKKALNKNTEEVADILTKPLYDILFPGGKFAASGEMRDQLNRLQNAIQAKMPEVVKILQADKEIGPLLQKVPGLTSSAKHGYTARILRDFMKDTLELIEDETADGDEAPTEQEVQSAATKAVKKAAVKQAPEAEAGGEAPEESKDRTTVRIEHMIANKVDDTGVLESEVVNDVQREVMSSGGLGLEEKSILSKVKAIISNLVRKQILERKGQYLKYGENIEKFDAAGDTGSEAITDEDLVQKYTGIGTAPKTSRAAWGGEETGMARKYGIDLG